MYYIEESKLVSLTEASEYLILPAHKAALPISHTLTDTLAAFLVSQGDYHSSQSVADYARIPASVLPSFTSAGFSILPVLREIETAKPISILTESERKRRAARIREQAKREGNERREAERARHTAKLIL